MSLSHETFPPQLVVFTLVLVRVSVLVMIAPVFGSAAVPARVRSLMALAFAAMITPIELERSTLAITSLTNWLMLAGAEALIGLALGIGVLVLFAGIQVSGQVLSQMSGLQLADVYDPSFDGQTSVLSQFLFYISLAVFVAIGGHRMVLEGLLDTFVWAPAGNGSFQRPPLEAMTSLLTQSFALGCRAAAPALVSVLLATLVLGLIGRTMPQLNLLALGFGFNVLVMLTVVGISLGAGAWAFQDQLAPMLQTALSALRPSAS